MELNKYIKDRLKTGEILVYDKLDYYCKVARLLRYHYIGQWGNHFFISEKEQPKRNNKLRNGDRPRLIIPKTTKQTMKNGFFYTLARKHPVNIPTYRGNN